MDGGGISDLGQKIGKSKEYVSHRMQLLKLPDGVRSKIIYNDLSISQAMELTNIDDSLKNEFVDEIINNKLTVKQIRVIKKTIKHESDLHKPIRNKNSKSLNLAKKSTLTLKITLSRIVNLIEDAHGIEPKQRVEMVKFLMDLRFQIHSMIDDTIKFKKKYSK